jgi:hypothetical protein
VERNFKITSAAAILPTVLPEKLAGVFQNFFNILNSPRKRTPRPAELEQKL